MDLDEFNALSESDAQATVAVWAAIPGWVDAVVAGRPYSSADALASYASSLASVWSRADLDAALSHHPRIGDKPRGSGATADASRAEQSSMSTAADDIVSALATGNADYEARFGRVFLIRAAGRTPAEMLSHLHRRLENDEADEAREATEQLAEIALLRLRTTIGTDAVTPEEQE
ncbi:2-oxo-4-hydroxy-4-carboxy-5-ureidoimidazoline decarboxylase [Microbacterium endophyticum]|uniref:2-oxo-4-hydroxy-4-carboxy-5-ureidoimidazoline decarboxylase n=1 Tax=Microbacterium endophyticum TaxID=1526412 RepID=A0A7W4V5A4_9MICO|nr:2-oxo-4-hydroxy-4-carboxy-5-ureidoimidazoline decarboxylase [Microbacterium endophyticum]MBB2977117.1 2-oxo-4-hydroxy-4-carboxy-5-ureidoimidazoline decarboxylase [Microbacterium endophyticum]NIK36045.1 2-oxo-4-hydroxy-4-carboxy-5-ureidoimidazoline decarboxylase [Microbacterium endophyticum]